MNMTSMNICNRVLVVGGGAAGLFAAGTAAERGCRVTILEKNERPGKKLLITGKGRCNVTNNCPPDEVLKNVPTNPRFLYSAVYHFPPEKTMRFFEEHGCPLKTERGNRVFPVSDRSGDILDALRRWLQEQNVRILQETAQEIVTEDGCAVGVKTDRQTHYADCVILAVGGCSYPLTGSEGDGYKMAQALGHTIVPPVGSLVPLVEKGLDCSQMQGLALKNVTARLLDGKGKKVFEEFGELLFTHFGLSGPIILSASAHMKKDGPYRISLDLKPALDEKTLDARLLRDFEKYKNRDFLNALQDLLPSSMIPVVVRRSGIPKDEKVNAVTKEQRRELLNILKNFTVEIACKAPVEEAIVTSGGVRTAEVDPKTMESKKVKGLYFAGEILDVDAYTGGFNLQIAWATGYAAGCAAAKQDAEEEANG
jgi:predicted Rossmann fold flavoprotein